MCYVPTLVGIYNNVLLRNDPSNSVIDVYKYQIFKYFWNLIYTYLADQQNIP